MTKKRTKKIGNDLHSKKRTMMKMMVMTKKVLIECL